MKRRNSGNSSPDRTVKSRNDDGTPPNNPNTQADTDTQTNAAPNNMVNTGNSTGAVNNAQTTANSSVQQTSTNANSIPLVAPANNTPSQSFNDYLAMAALTQTQGNNTTANPIMANPIIASKPLQTVTSGKNVVPGVTDNQLQPGHAFSPSNSTTILPTTMQSGLANITSIPVLKPVIPPPNYIGTNSFTPNPYSTSNPGSNQMPTSSYHNPSTNTTVTTLNLGGASKSANPSYPGNPGSIPQLVSTNNASQSIKLDNAPLLVDKDFVITLMEHLNNTNAKWLRYSKKYGNHECTIDAYKVIHHIMKFAFPQSTLPRYFYETRLIKVLAPYMACTTATHGVTVTPLSNDWKLCWNAVAKDVYVYTACEHFIDDMIKNFFRPMRYSKSGPRSEKAVKETRNSDFRKELDIRDQDQCVVTGVYSHDSERILGPNVLTGALEGAHILPHHMKSKEHMLKVFEMFGGTALLDTFKDTFDSVSNGILLDLNCHKAFDMLHWSIEAINGEYIVRRVHDPPAAGTSTPLLKDGRKITFAGNPTKWPNPDFCNLHLAIARVAYATGLADVYNEMDFEDDNSNDPVPSNSTNPVEEIGSEGKEKPLDLSHSGSGEPKAAMPQIPNVPGKLTSSSGDDGKASKGKPESSQTPLVTNHAPTQATAA